MAMFCATGCSKTEDAVPAPAVPNDPPPDSTYSITIKATLICDETIYYIANPSLNICIGEKIYPTAYPKTAGGEIVFTVTGQEAKDSFGKTCRLDPIGGLFRKDNQLPMAYDYDPHFLTFQIGSDKIQEFPVSFNCQAK